MREVLGLVLRFPLWYERCLPCSAGSKVRPMLFVYSYSSNFLPLFYPCRIFTPGRLTFDGADRQSAFANPLRQPCPLPRPLLSSSLPPVPKTDLRCNSENVGIRRMEIISYLNIHYVNSLAELPISMGLQEGEKKGEDGRGIRLWLFSGILLGCR